MLEIFAKSFFIFPPPPMVGEFAF